MIKSVITLVALMFPAGKTEAPAKAPALFPVEKQIIERTNNERVRHGLPPLAVDRQLIQSARKHAFWMANYRSLQHAHTASAENIAQGQTSAGHAVSCWMNSPGHRANILGRRYRRIGVAAFVAGNGQTYWCQQFQE